MKYNLLFSIIFLLCCSIISNISYAQDREEKKTKDKPDIGKRIFTGGNIGLYFGNITYLNLSPVIGYRITNKLSAGAGVTYIYYQNNIYNFNTSMYGGKIFSRYSIIENLFAHTEYELLNLEIYDILTANIERRWIGSFLVGGGYRQLIGGFSSLDILLLYDLNYSEYSPNASPVVFRMGVTVGL